jgi:hypothetical protein
MIRSEGAQGDTTLRRMTSADHFFSLRLRVAKTFLFMYPDEEVVMDD